VDEPVPTDLFLTLDVFCGPGFPESPVKGDREAEAGCVDPDETTRLCTGERSTDPDTLTIKGEGDETEVVTSGLEIIQMFAR